MSAMNGEGYGDCHDWQRLETLPWKVTEYKCRDCGAFFRHCYADIPDIFEAMEFCRVPEKCDALEEISPEDWDRVEPEQLVDYYKQAKAGGKPSIKLRKKR